jgi:hypothetical protein
LPRSFLEIAACGWHRSFLHQMNRTILSREPVTIQ